MSPLPPVEETDAVSDVSSAGRPQKLIPRPLKAVLFDFDGTLAELSVDFIRMRRAVLDLMGDYCTPTDSMHDLYVLEMIEAGRCLISKDRPGKEGEFFARAHELISAIETEGACGGALFAGTEEMLRELRRRQIKSGVVTRNCRAAVLQLFPDIDSRCDVVITREGAAQVKPHPGHLLTALGFLDTNPEFAAMVGDHPMDIAVGREVGTYTIGVLTGYSEAPSLRQAGADLVIERASDITGLL